MEPRMEQPSMSRKDSDQATSSRKRPRTETEVDPSPNLPSSDRHSSYYPGLPMRDEEEEEELQPGTVKGNWGRKHQAGARFVRRGHIAAWAPTRKEHDIEERARKRLRAILPEFTGETIQRDPILPHLRSPSPPMVAPYTPAPTNFTTYTQSIFDPNIGASFRSNLLGSLERSASELITSEIALTRALGRFWTALTETTNRLAKDQRHAILQDYRKFLAENRTHMDVEPDEPVEQVEGTPLVNGIKEHSPASSTPAFPPVPDHLMAGLEEFTTRNVIMRIFTLNKEMRLNYTSPAGATEIISVMPQHQVDLVTRSMTAVRELQEDSKECMERLEEIREMLGRVKGLRDAVWAVMRSRAILEMENDE